MERPYPLTFEPILKEKVWGGTRLARYGKRLGPGRRYGESWEVADLAATSSSGGGGDPAHSVIDSGTWRGRTLRDAVREWGRGLLGDEGLVAARQFGYRGDAAFPLLVKFLDAAEHLSVQVHPSKAYAQRFPEAHLKTESWYVLDAERTTLPDGTGVDPSVFVGLVPGVSAEAFRADIERGMVAGDLVAMTAEVGACHTLPSGTCHALGAGVLVAEVQTPSDTTFRVYDWTREYGREHRELHVDEALACLDFSGEGAAAPCARGLGRLSTTAYYTIDAVEPGEAGVAVGDGACVVLMAVAGSGELVSASDVFEPVKLPVGRTAVVPAEVADAAVRGREGFRVLVVGIGAG